MIYDERKRSEQQDEDQHEVVLFRQVKDLAQWLTLLVRSEPQLSR